MSSNKKEYDLSVNRLLDQEIIPAHNRKRQSSISIREELAALGVSPANILVKIIERAMAAFDERRGQSDSFDPGAQYLAVAEKAAATLSKYLYPTMTAIKVDGNLTTSNKMPPNALEAQQIINSDPFAKMIVQAMKSPEYSETKAIIDGGLPVGPAQKNGGKLADK